MFLCHHADVIMISTVGEGDFITNNYIYQLQEMVKLI